MQCKCISINVKFRVSREIINTEMFFVKWRKRLSSLNFIISFFYVFVRRRREKQLSVTSALLLSKEDLISKSLR